MQLFIDNELSYDEKATIFNHLKHCEKCSDLYQETIQDKENLLQILSLLDSDFSENEIPEFKKPTLQKRINRFTILKIAASFVLLMGLFFLWKTNQDKQKNKNDSLQAQYELLDQTDQNKKWHKKQIDVVITDANGNIEETFMLEN
jgi:preprotein translocase subunit SecG